MTLFCAIKQNSERNYIVPQRNTNHSLFFNLFNFLFILLTIVFFFFVLMLFNFFFFIILLFFFQVDLLSLFPIVLWMFIFVMNLHRLDWRLLRETFFTDDVDVLFTLFWRHSFLNSICSSTTTTSFHLCCMNFTFNLFCSVLFWFCFPGH